MDYRAVIQDSLDYIETNIAAEVSAQELADRACFSLFHYYRLFQTATGMPVMQYILRRRLLHAIYAVRCGSSGIDAAMKYGFDTYAGFYKAFRREFGCTPSHFLKTCRAERPWRVDLMQEEHMGVTRRKAAHILKKWGLEQESLSDVYSDENGSRHDNAYYVGEGYVLKYTANLGKLHKHLAASKAIASMGLYTAESVKTCDGQEYIRDGELYFYVTKRLPGDPMKAGKLYEGDAAANGRFVGEIIGQLHLALKEIELCANETDTLETVKTWALPTAKDAMGLPESFCHKYVEAFEELYPQLPRQVIHRDPNPGNIIRAEDKWGFIDFELTERNVRIYDPCYAATAVLSESFGKDNDGWLEIYRNILTGYDSVVPLSLQERLAVPYVILANQLVCVAWFAQQEKYAELFEVNKCMTAWLMENLEKLKL